VPLRSEQPGDLPRRPFAVDDIESEKAALEAKGIEFYGAVNVVDRGWCGRMAVVYFNDPEDIRSSSWRSRTTNTEERRAGIAGVSRVANLDDQSARAAGQRGHPSSERSTPFRITLVYGLIPERAHDELHACCPPECEENVNDRRPSVRLQ